MQCFIQLKDLISKLQLFIAQAPFIMPSLHHLFSLYMADFSLVRSQEYGTYDPCTLSFWLIVMLVTQNVKLILYFHIF